MCAYYIARVGEMWAYFPIVAAVKLARAKRAAAAILVARPISFSAAKDYAQKVIDEGYGGNEEVLLSMSYADSFYPSENYQQW